MRPLVLSGYAAKQCARRVHNEWDATIEAELVPVSAQLQARFDEGRAFEARIHNELAKALGERAVFVPQGTPRSQAVAATARAMAGGVEVVVGGWLPDDLPGGRTGRPDLLLRTNESRDTPSYVPGDIKAHLMTKPSVRGWVTYSTLVEPGEVIEEQGRSVRISDRYDDFIQLAHYIRMLQACGFAERDAYRGFIIGTDLDAATGDPFLTWVDLQDPVFNTFSRSRGTARRSALERYDHEHGFRLKVAQIAGQRTGSSSDPLPLVVPIITDECEVCPWSSYCREEIGVDAASAVLEAGRLDVREWQALSALGIHTAQDLAALDIDDDAFWESYLPEVIHQRRAQERLTTAVTRARMALAGTRIQRTTTGPIDVPRTDVEIDFDIEWDTDNRVFLWGALLTDKQHPNGTYVPFSTLESLDERSERELGQNFLTWLREQIQRAESQGRSLAVFHYSHPERSHLTRVFGEDAVADVLPYFVDLLPIVRAHFIGVAGLSIKEVAPEFDFHWLDEDPGGLQAQMWLQAARETDATQVDTLRARLLAYNEDDVRATAAVRAGIHNV